MNQSKPKQTLSIRIDRDLYVLISQHALKNDLPSLNAAIVDLIDSGLNSITNRDEIISQFIFQIVPEDQLEKLINGR